MQIGGRFTDRVYANNNAAVRSVGIHSSRARKGYRRTRIGAVKARTSRLGRSLNDSPDNGDECGHNSPRLRNVCAPRSRLCVHLNFRSALLFPISYFSPCEFAKCLPCEIEGEMDRKIEWKTRRIDAKWTRRMIVRSSWHER